jgi:hypothetical protein
MAAGTLECQSQESRRKSVVAIGHVLHPEFLGSTSPLDLLGVQAIESGRQFMLLRGIGKQVSCQLPGDKLVIRLVAVNCINHPVTPGPDIPVPIDLVSVGVRIAGQIEPDRGNSLPKCRAGKKPVDKTLERTGPGICQELVNFGKRGRQAGEIKTEPADQLFPAGIPGRGKSDRLQAGQHKVINGVARPILLDDCRQVTLLGSLEGPVVIPPCPLLDPATQDLNFREG